MYNGQTSFFKSKHFINSLSETLKVDAKVNRVNEHAKQYPNSRTAKAIELTIKFYPFVVSEHSLSEYEFKSLCISKALIQDVYDFCYEKSGVFKISHRTYRNKIKSVNFESGSSINTFNSNTRSDKILRALS